jgi:hypothetical protein
MSLRKINRQRMGHSSIGSIFGFGKKTHFKKLGKSADWKTPEPKEDGYVHPRHTPTKKNLSKNSKNLITILIIAAIAITIIAVEIMIWSGNQDDHIPEPTNFTNDTVNLTPITINDTPELPKPDLDIDDITLNDSDISVGDSITITAFVKNKGNLNASNVTVGFFAGVVSLGAAVIENIAEGETVQVSIEWAPPSAEFIGEYDITAKADPDGEIDEENELNNDGDVELTVDQLIMEDVSADFMFRRTNDFNQHWYSDNPNMTGMLYNGGDEGYTYFQIYKNSGKSYYLDVFIPGFKYVKASGVGGIFIPAANENGWDSNNCIKETLGDDRCVWNGPQIQLTISIDSKKLKITDFDGQTSVATTTDNAIDNINLIGLKTAKWPEELRTWKVTNGPEPNNLVPFTFYEVDGRKIVIHPMRWNPKTFEAEVALWYRFEIIVD